MTRGRKGAKSTGLRQATTTARAQQAVTRVSKIRTADDSEQPASKKTKHTYAALSFVSAPVGKAGTTTSLPGAGQSEAVGRGIPDSSFGNAHCKQMPAKQAQKKEQASAPQCTPVVPPPNQLTVEPISPTQSNLPSQTVGHELSGHLAKPQTNAADVQGMPAPALPRLHPLPHISASTADPSSFPSKGPVLHPRHITNSSSSGTAGQLVGLSNVVGVSLEESRQGLQTAGGMLEWLKGMVAAGLQSLVQVPRDAAAPHNLSFSSEQPPGQAQQQHRQQQKQQQGCSHQQEQQQDQGPLRAKQMQQQARHDLLQLLRPDPLQQQLQPEQAEEEIEVFSQDKLLPSTPPRGNPQEHDAAANGSREASQQHASPGQPMGKPHDGGQGIYGELGATTASAAKRAVPSQYDQSTGSSLASMTAATAAGGGTTLEKSCLLTGPEQLPAAGRNLGRGSIKQLQGYQEGVREKRGEGKRQQEAEEQRQQDKQQQQQDEQQQQQFFEDLQQEHGRQHQQLRSNEEEQQQGALQAEQSLEVQAEHGGDGASTQGTGEGDGVTPVLGTSMMEITPLKHSSCRRSSENGQQQQPDCMLAEEERGAVDSPSLPPAPAVVGGGAIHAPAAATAARPPLPPSAMEYTPVRQRQTVAARADWQAAEPRASPMCISPAAAVPPNPHTVLAAAAQQQLGCGGVEVVEGTPMSIARPSPAGGRGFVADDLTSIPSMRSLDGCQQQGEYDGGDEAEGERSGADAGSMAEQGVQGDGLADSACACGEQDGVGAKAAAADGRGQNAGGQGAGAGGAAGNVHLMAQQQQQREEQQQVHRAQQQPEGNGHWIIPQPPVRNPLGLLNGGRESAGVQAGRVQAVDDGGRAAAAGTSSQTEKAKKKMVGLEPLEDVLYFVSQLGQGGSGSSFHSASGNLQRDAVPAAAGEAAFGGQATAGGHLQVGVDGARGSMVGHQGGMQESCIANRGCLPLAENDQMGAVWPPQQQQHQQQRQPQRQEQQQQQHGPIYLGPPAAVASMQLSILAGRASISTLLQQEQQQQPRVDAEQSHQQQQPAGESSLTSSRSLPGASAASGHADLDQPDPLEQAWLEHGASGQLPAGLTPGLWAAAVALAEGNCRVVGPRSVGTVGTGGQVGVLQSC